MSGKFTVPLLCLQIDCSIYHHCPHKKHETSGLFCSHWMWCCVNNNNNDNKTTTKASSRTKHKFTSHKKWVRCSFSLFFLNQITSYWNVVAVDPVVVVMSFFLFFRISVPCTDSATWLLIEEWFKSRVGWQCWWMDNKIGGRMWLMEKESF